MWSEVPVGWSRSKLRDLGLVDCGKAKSPRQRAPLRPYLRVANVLDGRIDTSDVYRMPFSDEEFKRYKLEPGDILLNEGQSLKLVGRPAVYRGRPSNVAMQNALLRWRPDPHRVDPEFGYQSIRSLYRTGAFSQIATQTTSIAHLGLKRFAGVEVPLPPVPEQKKIAAILSSVDDAIQATQAVIEQTRRVKEGLLQDLLTRGMPGHTRFKKTEIGVIPEGWEIRRLQDVCRHKITYGIVQCGPHVDSGVPYVRVSDMLAPELSVTQMLRTDPAIAAKFSRSRVEVGDVVYALRGKIGEVRLVSPGVAGANLTQGTARLSPATGVTPEFLLWAMRSPTTMRQGELEAKGSTFREITLARLRMLRVPVPPLAEQDAIVHRLQAADSGERYGAVALESLRTLKSGLLQDLLTGKVRVTP
ncbi:MAG: hypothetical protein GXP62_11190 [Oligoflexia bacterium]|nr:hypothetical protein [Oligoflexia bacterium]